jgi:Bacterial lipoate protein ligase C-terminus.
LIEKALTDVNFDKDSLIKALKTVDLKANLGDIEPELLADLLLSK